MAARRLLLAPLRRCFSSPAGSRRTWQRPRSLGVLTTVVLAGSVTAWLYADDVSIVYADSPLSPDVASAVAAFERDPHRVQRPRLVILGSGWGATAVLNNLDKDNYDVTIISPSNNFFFTPLLPASCVGTIESRSLVEPIRRIGLRLNAFYYEGEAEDVDLQNRKIRVVGSDGNHFDVAYDILVVAVGSRTNTFGLKGVDEHCHFLKTVADARKIRIKIMTNFEHAALPTTTLEQRRKLLTFVICGGGPTGVEVAAELHDFLKDDLQRYFPNIVKDDVSVYLIQSGDHILNTYDAKISKYTESKFQRQGIHLITNARVTDVQADKIMYTSREPDGSLATKCLSYGFCLWSTGIGMQPITQAINQKLADQKHLRALQVDDGLMLKGVDTTGVYAIGDCATIENVKLLDKMLQLFQIANKSEDGVISLDEFKSICTWIRKNHPRAALHLKKMKKLFIKYDKDHSSSLDINEFKQLLQDIDIKLKSLPATAQVAAQQGKYLARKLNHFAKDIKETMSTRDGSRPPKEITTLVQALDAAVDPFDYKHGGSLAYIGSDSAVADFGGGIAGGGLAVFWLWRGVYFSEQVSLRTRVLLAFDWFKRVCFGRDLSKY